MKRCFWIGCFCMVSLLQVWALSPKREFRASWVVTVWRNDWPETVITGTGSVREANIAKQKQELVAIFDSLKAAGMNAVFSRCAACRMPCINHRMSLGVAF